MPHPAAALAAARLEENEIDQEDGGEPGATRWRDGSSFKNFFRCTAQVQVFFLFFLKFELELELERTGRRLEQPQPSVGRGACGHLGPGWLRRGEGRATVWAR
eukprot:SAG11_NODE_16260_length_553_cov_0.568282_2_plen_102_part_01